MDTEPKEHSDLLKSDQKELSKLESNGNVRHVSTTEPPDGGFRAYSVMVGSFLTNGLLFGVINSYSVVYAVLLKQLQEEKVPYAEIRASLVGALTMGTTFILSPLSSLLTAFLGLRMTAVLGGSIATAGLFLSSFVVNHVDALCLTYGILYGLGASLAYTPSLAILGHYFKKYLGLVNGIVTIGSCVFTVLLPPLMDFMISKYSLEWMFRVLAALTFGIALCGLLFKPIPIIVIEKPLKKGNSFKVLWNSIGSIQLWKNKKYRLWAMSMPVALFGYFVPYVHIKKFTEIHIEGVNVNLPLQCIAITSAVGRLTFGFLADRPNIDRIMLQQISFYVIGTLTIILAFVRSFWLVVAIALGMGIFEGGFIALMGPISFELCGECMAAQGIGCVLGMAAVPLSVGPPVAGALFSFYNSYTVPFVLAGISPIVGATLMFAIRFSRSNQNAETNSNGHISLNRNDVELNPTPLLKLDKEVNQRAES